MKKINPDQFLSGECPDCYCPECGERHEWVRPGKTQPVCGCHLVCHKHGKTIEYFGMDDERAIKARTYGWLCPHCEFDNEE